MDPGDLLLAVVALAISCTLVVTFGIGWFRASRRVRELERQLDTGGSGAAVEELEASLAELSGQVEQLANGQDFLSRVLTERARSPRPQPEVTPL
jgi:hypothetical protein